MLKKARQSNRVIASEAKQSIVPQSKCGLLRRYAPRNDAERAVYLPPSGPIIRSGSAVEISGTKHSSSTASIISSTNGSVPQITSLSGISGATLRMTKMLRPTGGGISPLSITMVMTTAQHMMSEFAARRGGGGVGAGLRRVDAGRRGEP